MNCVQRKTARPDVRVSEITVDVDPTGETKNCGAALHLSRAPKFRMRKIVVVRLENERRARTSGEKLAARVREVLGLGVRVAEGVAR